jgi:hypothetical protein
VIPFVYCLLFPTVTHAEVFRLREGDSVQSAINEASPGDSIILEAGTYEEDFSTELDGEPGSPITIKADEGAEVIITSNGEVFQIDHSHWHVEGVIFDGQYGNANVLDINDDAHFLRLDNVEVRRSGNDCVDLSAPSYVEIKNSRIHHCLRYDEDSEEFEEAHGISAGSVQNLSIINTDVHTFSGSGIQLDPSRSEPGWNEVIIEACRIWLDPLAEVTNGFPAGFAPGKNGIQTKTLTGGTRAILRIEDTEFWGFREGRDLTDLAALLLWEHVDVRVSRSIIYDSDVAVRVRSPVLSRPEGAQVSIDNTIIHTVSTGFRYERDIESLNILFVTMGTGVEQVFDSVDPDAIEPVVQNSLFLQDSLPSVAESDTNGLAAKSDFVDADTHDYHLKPTAPAIDAGIDVSFITVDFDGEDRVQGEAPDQGAFEYAFSVPDTGVPDDTGEVDEGDDTDAPSTDTGEAVDTGISAEIDDDLNGGIGAAESVGEKGGCGCSQSTASRAQTWPLLAFFAGLFLRYRRQSQSNDSSAHINFEMPHQPQ